MNKAQKIATIKAFIIWLLYASAMCHRLKLLCPLSLSFLALYYYFFQGFKRTFDHTLLDGSAPFPF